MKSKYTLLLILAAGLFLQLKCRKNTEPQGYYFQCKLDGKLYIPDGFCSNCKVALLLNDTTLVLSGNRSIEIVLLGINDGQNVKEGEYVLNNVIGRRGSYKNSFTTDDRFFTDSLRTGQLIIKRLDKGKKEIEGIFSFKAFNPVQNKTVNVTEGKFKLKYTTY